MLPDRPDIALRIEHFIGDAGQCAIAEDRIVADPVFAARRMSRLLL